MPRNIARGCSEVDVDAFLKCAFVECGMYVYDALRPIEAQ